MVGAIRKLPAPELGCGFTDNSIAISTIIGLPSSCAMLDGSFSRERLRSLGDASS